jgi:hypothetical protein
MARDSSLVTTAPLGSISHHDYAHTYALFPPFFPNWEQTVLVKPEGFSQPFVDVWSRIWMVLQYPCAKLLTVSKI